MLSAIALACALSVQEPETRRSPDEAVAALAQRFADLLYERRPWLALERLPPATPIELDLSRYGPEGLGWWRDGLQDLNLRLTELPLQRMDAEQRFDASALSGLVRAERIAALARSQERWNPHAYVDRLERTLIYASRRPRAAAAGHDLLLGLLTQVPPYWRDARRGLVTPHARWTDSAVQRLARLEDFIRSEIEPLLLETAPPEQTDEALAAVQEALRATEELRAWLAERPATVGGAVTSLGANSWLAGLRELTGSALTLQELRARLLRELALAEREHGRRWSGPPPAQTQAVDFGLVSVTERRIEAASARAVELSRAAGLLTTLAPPIECRVDEAAARLGRTALVLPGDADSLLPPRLLVEPALVLADEREPLLVCGIRFGGMGEALLRSPGRTPDSPLPRMLWNPALLEGWGLYVLTRLPHLPLEPHPWRGDTALAAEAARVRALEAARLLTALEYHAQGRSLEDVTLALARRSGLDASRAELEARRAVENPWLGIGYVGHWELLALEEGLAATFGEREALARTLELVRQRPHGRPADLRLLAAPEPRPDSAVTGPRNE